MISPDTCSPHLVRLFTPRFWLLFVCSQAPEDKRDMQPVPNIDHLLSNIGRPGMPGEASGEGGATVAAATSHGYKVIIQMVLDQLINKLTCHLSSLSWRST